MQKLELLRGGTTKFETKVKLKGHPTVGEKEKIYGKICVRKK